MKTVALSPFIPYSDLLTAKRTERMWQDLGSGGMSSVGHMEGCPISNSARIKLISSWEM